MHADRTRALLDAVAGRDVPGLQYVVVDASGVRYEHAAGLADIAGRRAMTGDTTLMAYSMTKTITAVAVLQLAERGRLALDDPLDRWVPGTPYAGQPITVRHLLTHTAGLPNPIPLRWVHLAAEDATFDERAALAAVMRAHPRLRHPPGRRFLYSNIGYWLLGQVVEAASGRRYADVVRAGILAPLGLAPTEMDFGIADPARHAGGYLAKWSLLNLLKGLVTDRRFWGGYEGRWLRFRSHHLDGPAFGGLVGTARGFGRFLQDQLAGDSVLLGRDTKRLLETRAVGPDGRPFPITPGWHVREVAGIECLYKEGGGGGFHAEMRLYPSAGIGTVLMANGTELRTDRLLTRVDAAFLETR